MFITEFRDKIFKDRVDLLAYIIYNNITDFPETLFHHSDLYYSMRALEDKFQRFFSIEELLKIYKDKSWQWRKPLQPNFKEKAETHASQI